MVDRKILKGQVRICIVNNENRDDFYRKHVRYMYSCLSSLNINAQ